MGDAIRLQTYRRINAVAIALLDCNLHQQPSGEVF